MQLLANLLSWFREPTDDTGLTPAMKREMDQLVTRYVGEAVEEEVTRINEQQKSFCARVEGAREIGQRR